MPHELNATKTVSAGVFVLDEAENVLLVKPIHRETWTTVGGFAEPYESPRETARREAEEELGIPLVLERLLTVDYLASDRHGLLQEAFENVAFQFLAKPLRADDISRIKVQKTELSAYCFVPQTQLSEFVASPFLEATEIALRAVAEKRTIYTENLREVGA